MISPSYSPIIFRVERFAPSPIGHILLLGLSGRLIGPIGLIWLILPIRPKAYFAPYTSMSPILATLSAPPSVTFTLTYRASVGSIFASVTAAVLAV